MGADVANQPELPLQQGGLTLRVEERPLVVQPNPFFGWRNRRRAADRR